jgi:transketolase
MADPNNVRRLEEAALDVRLKLLDLCSRTSIHIGGDMSVCDMMTVIWQYAMRYDVKDPQWEDRDRFILSKGHAAAVTSFSQAAIGCYDPDEIYAEYATDFGRFGMHSCNLINPYVEVSTGSLGHGLPVAGGIAAALRAKGSESRVYVVCGDGELHEGSIWEAAMSSRHFRLGNLVVFIDRNRLSLDGGTEDLMSLEPLADKWRAFGWNVIEVDGHSMEALVDTVDALPSADGGVPTVIIGNTVKGHGIGFMENNPSWHTGLINAEQLDGAKAELLAAFSKKWGAK